MRTLFWLVVAGAVLSAYGWLWATVVLIAWSIDEVARRAHAQNIEHREAMERHEAELQEVRDELEELRSGGQEYDP